MGAPLPPLPPLPRLRQRAEWLLCGRVDRRGCALWAVGGVAVAARLAGPPVVRGRRRSVSAQGARWALWPRARRVEEEGQLLLCTLAVAVDEMKKTNSARARRRGVVVVRQTGKQAKQHGSLIRGGLLACTPTPLLRLPPRTGLRLLRLGGKQVLRSRGRDGAQKRGRRCRWWARRRRWTWRRRRRRHHAAPG